MCTWYSFSGVKASGVWSWQSPLISAEVKNTWIYTSTLPYVFMAWFLIS
jgi:hypothetical protein